MFLTNDLYKIPDIENISTYPKRYAFSPNNKYLVLGFDTIPYLEVYKIDGEKYTKLDFQAPITAANVYDIKFSPDGKEFVAITYTNPILNIYTINDEDVIEKVSNDRINALPSGNGYSCTYSPDGKYLAVSFNDSPYINIYKIDNTSNLKYTRLPNPSSLPSNIVYECTFSPDGTLLIATSYAAPYIIIYKIEDNDVFTRLPNPHFLPSQYIYRGGFSSDGKYYAAAMAGGSIGIILYKIENGNFININIKNANIPKAMPENVTFIPNTHILIGLFPGNDQVLRFIIINDTLHTLPSIDSNSNGYPFWCSCSQNGELLAISHKYPPYLSIYKIPSYIKTVINKDNKYYGVDSSGILVEIPTDELIKKDVDLYGIEKLNTLQTNVKHKKGFMNNENEISSYVISDKNIKSIEIE